MSAEIVPVLFTIDGPKVSAYLLNLESKRGASKAKYLMRFGFTPAEPKVLADALAAHAISNFPGTVQPQPDSPNRIRFEGRVRAPDGRDMPLATVWEATEGDGERRMRFITAFPP
ncbi:DUF6883 domain-containing protein [Methylobacterium sp. WL2]|uniref:DUF6883 domain-containing protein n=1 Tax=Methylobacterium sp. WL2 TaxID=2603902 RepID=UPI0011C923DE|nr:DUF6883 domain-containing protein [Methylobacterium sp. WL2]TXN51619.1 hypothetical protein FV241_30000 [Methylobacterium sp. WL2]